MTKQNGEVRRYSAGCVISYPESDGVVLVTGVGRHYNELTVPRGGWERIDKTLIHTALRETEEETGGGKTSDTKWGLKVRITGRIDPGEFTQDLHKPLEIFTGIVTGGHLRTTKNHPRIEIFPAKAIANGEIDEIFRGPTIEILQAYVGGLIVPLCDISSQTWEEELTIRPDRVSAPVG